MRIIRVIGNGIHAGLMATSLAALQRKVWWETADVNTWAPPHHAPIFLAPRPAPGIAMARQLDGASRSLSVFREWMRQICQCDAPLWPLDVVTDNGLVFANASAVINAYELWRLMIATSRRLHVRFIPPQRRRIRGKTATIRLLPIALSALGAHPEEFPLGRIAICWTSRASWHWSWTFPWDRFVYHDMFIETSNMTHRLGAMPLGMDGDSWGAIRGRSGDMTIWMRDLSAIIAFPDIVDHVTALIDAE